MARSISPASRRLIGLTSTLSDGATAWMTPNWTGPTDTAASRRTATRVTLGAISLSSSSHFPLRLYSRDMNPVALPPGQAVDEASADRITDDREHDRHCAGCLQQWPHGRGARGQDDVRCERDQFRRVSTSAVGIASAPAIVDPHVAALGPAQLLQHLQERRDAGLAFRIVRGVRDEHADAPHPLALLCERRERPRCRAADERDELAPSHHSITSSAVASSAWGTLRPSIRAV